MRKKLFHVNVPLSSPHHSSLAHLPNTHHHWFHVMMTNPCQLVGWGQKQVTATDHLCNAAIDCNGWGDCSSNSTCTCYLPRFQQGILPTTIHVYMCLL
jgi:hypothetical protein